MPVYTGTVDGETVREYPELAYNEKIVEVEYYYHYGELMNPFEPNPFKYNFYRITTEYIDIMQRKDSTFYYGRLNDHKMIVDGRTLTKDYLMQNPKLSTQPTVVKSRRRTTSSQQSDDGGDNRRHSYKPKKGTRCRRGYKLINGMCVKILK